MGCRNSKLGPDAGIPKNGDPGINPVFSLETNDIPHMTLSDCESKTKKSVSKSANKSDRSNPSGSDGEKPKSKRHKTKYDPRITAKYEVKALIGKGSYSKVVRVEHRLTKQPYAIKMIECKEGKESFEAELSILRRVKHPHVIQLIEVFETSDKIYMVMELATGGDLFDRIVSRGCFSEKDATIVLRMVLDGVKYLHSLGITHRDLKPDNLLFYHPGNDSKIMITDFGLASTRKSGGDMYMHTACGTPEYIAPEIVARKPYTCAVDLWAIGVIAYILLSGTFPFDDENRSRLYKLILRAKYSYFGEHWHEASDLAKDFIDHLLVVEPSVRLTAVESLKHPWIVNQGSVSATKKLQRSISQNLFKFSSHSSSRSSHSNNSERSSSSLRSGHHRVCVQDLQKLNEDPEVPGFRQKIIIST